MTVTLIAAVARNGVIGRDGRLPWHLPADMRRFREVTTGHVLVMGRRTYESIGRPLPGRTTVVVTGSPGWPGPGAGERPTSLHVAAGVPQALRLAARLDDETYVAGGARVYAEAAAHADRMLLTWVDAEPEGDTWFPDVGWAQWEQTAQEPFAGGRWATYLRRSDVGC